MTGKKNKKGIKCPGCGLKTEKNTYCDCCGRCNVSGGGPGELLPAGMKADRERGTYSFWSSWTNVLGRYITLLILLFGLSGVYRYITNPANEMQIIMSILIIGAWALMTINRTTIVLSPIDIRVKSGPIPVPFMGTDVYRKDETAGIELYRTISSSTGWSSTSYTLRITKTDGSVHDLVSLKNGHLAMEYYRFLKSFYTSEAVPEEISEEELGRFLASGAMRWSTIYSIGIILSLFLNLPALAFTKRWVFDMRYFNLFMIFSAGIFLLLYFHHRKYLSFWDSKPLREKEKRLGAGYYAVVSVLMSLLLTPVIMAVYNILFLL